jgi:hypothetical protein
MTTSSDDALPTLQRDVQRLLGRCLLRLQQYERLLKAILVDFQISGPAHALEAARAARTAETARKTLGLLVGDLLGSFVVPTDHGTPFEATTNLPDDTNSFSFRINIGLADADFARTETELKELVDLRNNLVHHFIEQHDIGSVDGCRGAQDALVADYSRIDQHLGRLREWAEEMLQCRRLVAEFVRSDEFRDYVVNGIAPDGTVDWPAAGIVCALREAADALAVNGWAPVAQAARWIAERHPHQLPAKYGCRSWRHVVHESRVFELRYLERDGQRSPWYRDRCRSTKSC